MYKRGVLNVMASNCMYTFYRMTVPPTLVAVCQRADGSLLVCESVSGDPLGFAMQLFLLPGKHVEAGGCEATWRKGGTNNTQPLTV